MYKRADNEIDCNYDEEMMCDHYWSVLPLHDYHYYVFYLSITEVNQTNASLMEQKPIQNSKC